MGIGKLCQSCTNKFFCLGMFVNGDDKIEADFSSLSMYLICPSYDNCCFELLNLLFVSDY